MLTLLTLCCFSIPFQASAEPPCGMVYGEDWGFAFTGPENWASACHNKAPQGTVLAMWPKAETWAKASGRIYVTVSNKAGESLEQFAAEELADFRAAAPGLKAGPVETITLPGQQTALVRDLSGDNYGNFERIAYVDMGKVYLIVVLTTSEQKNFKQFRPLLDAFVSSLLAIQVHIDDSRPREPGRTRS